MYIYSTRKVWWGKCCDRSVRRGISPRIGGANWVFHRKRECITKDHSIINPERRRLELEHIFHIHIRYYIYISERHQSWTLIDGGTEVGNLGSLNIPRSCFSAVGTDRGSGCLMTERKCFQLVPTLAFLFLSPTTPPIFRPTLLAGIVTSRRRCVLSR